MNVRSYFNLAVELERGLGGHIFRMDYEIKMTNQGHATLPMDLITAVVHGSEVWEICVGGFSISLLPLGVHGCVDLPS